MQTFLPLPNYRDSAKVLDKQRLGNQRRETKTLLNGGWRNHPASKMWKGYEYHLGLYGVAICEEWIAQGGKDNTLPVIRDLMRKFPDTGPPPWIGCPGFHAAHRSNLLRKNKEWYSQFGWEEPDNLPYLWPKPKGEPFQLLLF